MVVAAWLVFLLGWLLWGGGALLYSRESLAQVCENCGASITVHEEDDGSRCVPVLRIMSWNVRNYNLCNRMVEGRYEQEYPKPEVEKEALRKVLRRHRPDVFLIQEIGGDSYVRELMRDLAAEGLDYPFYHVHEWWDQDRKVALLSMRSFEVLPAQGEKPPEEEPKPLSRRGVLEVVFDLGEYRLLLAGFHLKSRFSRDPQDPLSARVREREARWVRDGIRRRIEEAPDRLVLAMGDLNDLVDSAPFRRFTRVGDRELLKEVSVQDARQERWTFNFDKRRTYEQVDFAFLRAVFADNRVWTIKGRIPHCEEIVIASDHRPIYVEICQKRCLE